MAEFTADKDIEERIADGAERRERVVRSALGIEKASQEEDILLGIDGWRDRASWQMKARDPNQKSGKGDLLQDLYENRDGTEWKKGRDHPETCKADFISLLNDEEDEIAVFRGKRVREITTAVHQEWVAAGKPSLFTSTVFDGCQIRKFNDPRSGTPKYAAFLPRKYCLFRVRRVEGRWEMGNWVNGKWVKKDG
jgi:hypothetical protein